MSSSERADAALLPGFERLHVSVEGDTSLVLVGGSGPALLMLHGDPQTHLCWHQVAPHFTDRFTVVLPDLRGRGDSHKPSVSSSPATNSYSKRVMAAEQVALMCKLGFDRFFVVGHDRGARVARRIALDHPDVVERLVVMDVVPVLDLYENVTAEIAQDYFYFFFLTQPHPQPEHLIAGDAEAFMRQILLGLSASPVAYDPDALAVYLGQSTSEASIVAMCECFRAGYTIDREHDAADRAADRQIECPTLVMWGETGVTGRLFDVPAIWNRWSRDVQFAATPGGHFIAEETPGIAVDQLRSFL